MVDPDNLPEELEASAELLQEQVEEGDEEDVLIGESDDGEE